MICAQYFKFSEDIQQICVKKFKQLFTKCPHQLKEAGSCMKRET